MTFGDPVAPADARAEIASLADDAGLHRVHFLTWRDLEHPEGGGSEIHANAIARIWAEVGVDVTVVTSAVPGLPSEVSRDGYRVTRRGGRLSVLVRSPWAEVRRALGPRDGLVEVWHGINFLAPLWARGPRIAIAHHVHGGQFHVVLPRGAAHLAGALERRVYPKLYRRTPLVTLSASTRAELLELGYRPDLVTVASPGVDERFSPGGARPDHPFVVGVGRLMPQKRFDVLIDVLGELRSRHPELRAVIAGDGPERERLEARVRAIGAGSWLRLAGRVSDAELVELYRRAWVVANTSTSEGWGMTLTEAASCGTPAVATAIAGHADAVVDGVTGFLASDDRELTTHLDAVIADGDRRRRLGEAALEHAARFTWDQAALETFAPLAADARRRRAGARGR